MTASDLLNDLRAQGFDLRTDGTRLWVTPRQRLTEDQAQMVAIYKGDLIPLVSTDPEVIRRRLVETFRQVDRLAAEVGTWIDRFHRLGDKLADESTWHGREGIPPDILNTLVRLTHPDRHGNSETANKATAWLLSQRRRLDS